MVALRSWKLRAGWRWSPTVLVASRNVAWAWKMERRRRGRKVAGDRNSKGDFPAVGWMVGASPLWQGQGSAEP